MKDKDVREEFVKKKLAFTEWRMHAIVVKETLNQSMRNMRNQSFKRRWENPQIKQQFNGNTRSFNMYRTVNIVWVLSNKGIIPE